MPNIFTRLRRGSPQAEHDAQVSGRLADEARRTQENTDRWQASERAAHNQAAENELRRQASDAESRRRSAENETRRQASDAEARRQAIENEPRHTTPGAPPTRR